MARPPTSFQKYLKLIGGAGLLTAGGLVAFERDNVKKYLYSISHKKLNEKKRIGSNSPDYIYIKYHIYKESLRLFKIEQEEDKTWIDVIINPVGKWWKTFKHSVAWRLLNIAQYGTQSERLKAVRQLAKVDHLKDWDFRHLAQLCDPRTGVSLARSGCDSRWFIPVHMSGLFKNPRVILSELKTLFDDLRPNSCVDYFMNKYFTITNFDDLDPYTEENYAVGTPIMSDDSDLLKEIISFLHHITKDEDVSLKLIQNGGLVLLMELKKIFEKDNETLANLCKTLANMSMAEKAANDFFVSGWVGVLAEWQTNADMRLQVISSKALANLDKDDPNNSVYPPNVYPLHPRLRTRSKPKGDVVFVHGLLGSVFLTWRQKDRYQQELGLYGKNAFYTSEADDVFLIGESKRVKNGNNGNGKTKKQILHSNPHQYVNNPAKKSKIELSQISDIATKELVEELQTSAELSPEWEVVHPDVPLEANEDCAGEFSVPGNKWKNEDETEEYTNCWPMDWLPEDYPNVRIIGIDYTSAVSEWSANFTKYCPCEKGSGQIDVRANSLLERIARSDVGENRPVVWIGHSMGGILTKLILLKALESPEKNVQQLAKNTKGIIFLGVPHRGSPIAKWKQHMQLILSPSIEVKEMEEGAPKLLEMHKKFMHCLRTKLSHASVLSIAEGSPTMLTTFKFPLRIVTEESAKIDYGDFYVLKDDHLSLSKPIFRQSFLYQRLLNVIDESMEKSTKRKSDDSNSIGNNKTDWKKRILAILEQYSNISLKFAPQQRSIEN